MHTLGKARLGGISGLAALILFLSGQLGFGQKPDATKKAPPQAKPSQSAAKPGQPSKAPPSTGKAAAKAGSTLEDMLARALRDNPDILVAAAKVREAEAELNRTRLQVTQKVVALHGSLESRRDLVRSAEAAVKNVKTAVLTGRMPQAELAVAESRLLQAKTELAEAEAQLPYLLGQQRATGLAGGMLGMGGGMMGVRGGFVGMAGGMMGMGGGLGGFGSGMMGMAGSMGMGGGMTGGGFGGGVGMGGGMMGARGGFGGIGGGLGMGGSAASGSLMGHGVGALTHGQVVRQAVAPTMAEKIRKALDTTISVNFAQTPLQAVLENLEDKTGLNIKLASSELSTTQVDLRLKQVPIGAVLQAIEDEFADSRNNKFPSGLRFAVRDYGLLLITSDRLPPGAILLHDFWKGGKDK